MTWVGSVFLFTWKKRDISQDLNEIIELKNKNEIHEALSRVNDLLSLGRLGFSEKLRLLALKSELLNLIGRHSEVIDLERAESSIISERWSTKDVSDLMKWYLNVITAHLCVENLDKAQQLISLAREVTKKLDESRDALYLELLDARRMILDGHLNMAREKLSELTDRLRTLVLSDDSLKMEILMDIGRVHLLKGEIHQTLSVLASMEMEGGDVPEQLLIRGFHAIMLAEASFMQLDNENALESLQEAIDLSRRLQNWYLEARATFVRVIQSVELNDAVNARKLVDHLERLASESKHPKIQKWLILSKGLILRLSKRALRLAESQEIFFKLQEDRILDSHERMLTKIHLAELLLLELQSFGNMEIFSELMELMQQMRSSVLARESYLWQVELNLLQSKIQLLEAKYREARKTLNDALQLAHSSGLKKLAVEVSTQMDVLDDEIEEWSQLEASQKHLTIKERIAHSQLKNVVMRMIKRRIEDIPHLKPEKPESFLIVTQMGEILFSHRFNPDRELDEELVGRFIAALHSFSKETFSEKGSIERVKHQDYTVLVNAVDNLFFCYLFQGQSYSALEKLSRFIKQAKKNLALWEALEQWQPSEPLPSAIEEAIRQITVSLFATTNS